MKKYYQSKAIVDAAVSQFTKVIAKIEQANKLLEQGVAENQAEYDQTCGEIVALQQKVDQISADIITHLSEVSKNKKTIEKFKGMVE